VRPVSRALDRLLRGLGIATDVARASAIDAWPAAAAAVLGADAAGTRAIGVDGATIVVAVPTPAWASEIRLRSAELVARIETLAPGSGIRAIRSIPSSRSRSS